MLNWVTLSFCGQLARLAIDVGILCSVCPATCDIYVEGRPRRRRKQNKCADGRETVSQRPFIRSLS